MTPGRGAVHAGGDAPSLAITWMVAEIARHTGKERRSPTESGGCASEID
jgi:hypothetical protein